MIVYLSGPMSGVENYRETFEAAARELTAAGHIVINPAEILQVMPAGAADRADFLLIDLHLLASAEAMLLLPGWHVSRGCLAERAFCQAVGIPVHEYDPPVADACPIGGCCR